MNLEQKGMMRAALLVGSMLAVPTASLLYVLFHDPENTDIPSTLETLADEPTETEEEMPALFTGELGNVKQYVALNGKYTAEATFTWIYQGKDDLGPVETGFSLCQGNGGCYTGRPGKTLDKVITGTRVEENIRLTSAGAVGKNNLVIGFMIKRKGETDYLFSDKYTLPDN